MTNHKCDYEMSGVEQMIFISKNEDGVPAWQLILEGKSLSKMGQLLKKDWQISRKK